MNGSRINHGIEKTEEQLHRERNPAIRSIEEAIMNLTRKAVTKEQIDAEIETGGTIVFPNTTVSVCCLTLKDGSYVVGVDICDKDKVFLDKPSMERAVKDARIQISDIVANRLNKEHKEKEENGKS